MDLSTFLSPEAYRLFERLAEAGGRPPDGRAFPAPGRDPLDPWPGEHPAPTDPFPDGSAFELRFDRQAILALRRSLVLGARTEYRSLEAASPDPSTEVTRALPPERVPERARRRAICTQPALADPGSRAEIESAISDGVEYRVVAHLPTSLLLVDGVALVPLTAGAEVALVTRAPVLVHALSQYFDLLWSRAAAYGGTRRGRGDLPSPGHLRILRLAASGLKDDAIARSVGVSVRSVRRYIDTLESQLGATNRLTLGIAAARRGWV